MNVTKLERIILDKRDISSLESQQATALRYANGEIDLYRQFSSILSDAEEAIAEITASLDDLSEDNRLFYNIWDDNYYYDYAGYEDFIERFIKSGAYKSTLRKEALELYEAQIESHRPEPKLAECLKLKHKIYIAQEKLNEKLRGLNRLEKTNLKLMQIFKTGRVYTSPSFLFAIMGEACMKGMMNGLNGTDN